MCERRRVPGEVYGREAIGAESGSFCMGMGLEVRAKVWLAVTLDANRMLMIFLRG